MATQKHDADGVPDHLRELVSLRDAGVVTAAEFETRSIELVRRL